MGYNIENTPSVLPQGAPTSPSLANIIAKTMDYRFEKLSLKAGFKYSRYADDLNFSIRGSKKLPSLKMVKKIINEKNIKYLKKGG